MNKENIEIYASFEQFMGCGIGTCRGCAIATTNGYKRVCKDGPVFNLKEIIFE
jgi:dihydroorotate dehydrogenase electron transfer subunit